MDILLKIVAGTGTAVTTGVVDSDAGVVVVHVKRTFLVAHTPEHSVVEDGLSQTRVAVFERLLVVVGRVLVDGQTVLSLVSVNEVLGRVGVAGVGDSTGETAGTVEVNKVKGAPNRTREDVLVGTDGRFGEHGIVVLFGIGRRSNFQGVGFAGCVCGYVLGHKVLGIACGGLPQALVVGSVVERRSLVEGCAGAEGVAGGTVDAAPVFILVLVAERQVVLYGVHLADDPVKSFGMSAAFRDGVAGGKDDGGSDIAGSGIAYDGYAAVVRHHLKVEDGAEEAGLGNPAVIELVVVAAGFRSVADHRRTCVLKELVAAADTLVVVPEVVGKPVVFRVVGIVHHGVVACHTPVVDTVVGHTVFV